MTETEWLMSSDPLRMLDFARAWASDRKMRLLACACCRRVWSLLSDHRSRDAVEVGERYADGQATEEELREAYRWANSVRANQDDPHFNAADAAWDAVQAKADAADAIDAAATELAMASSVDDASFDALYAETRSAFAAVVSDVLGNPFQQMSADQQWLGSEIVSLAESIYKQRSFDRMPELAAALEGAGCANTDIISHCQGSGPHVRGCWVLDLLLGKS